MSTLSKPPVTPGSEPSRDEDPTGVRALLSSLPAPDPMPAQLVARINASLAAEQLERAGRASGSAVTPLIAGSRRRTSRIWFAMAGAAAVIALVAVAGSNVFDTSQITLNAGSSTVAKSASSESTAGNSEADRAAAAPSAADRHTAFATPAASPLPVQIGQSGTQYTEAGFVSQVQSLYREQLPQAAARAAGGLGPAGTAGGLMECLGAIGARAQQVVRADVAFYKGRPAVIIVATSNNVPLAYVVGRECSRAHPTALRPATPLS